MTYIDPQIRGWHAHVYFDAATVDAARALCEEAARRFDLEMGRVHEKPVGPHPKWSCQLACSGDVFAELLPWLATNRGPLTVFAHPETGDHLGDHRDRAVWLGPAGDVGLALDLSIFTAS